MAAPQLPALAPVPRRNRIPEAQKVASWIADHWRELSLIVLVPVMALAAVLATKDFWELVASNETVRLRGRQGGVALLVLAVVAQIVFAVLNLRHSDRLSELRQAIEKANEEATRRGEDAAAAAQDIFLMFENHVQHLARQLDLTPKDRISLFAHDESAGVFTLLGRFSKNEEWRSPKSDTYPCAEGCIGEVWRRDEHYEPDFPAREDVEAFAAACARYRLDPARAMRMRMPSRFYFGRKIRASSGDRALAVLIIESVTPTRYQKGQLQELLDGPDGRHLQEAVTLLAKRIPNSRVAMEAGL